MKHRRTWISLLAVCALLAQTLAFAGVRPMSHSATPVQAQQSQDQSMPCHSGAAAQDEASSECCGSDACACAALCGGGSALTASALLPALIPAAEPVVMAAASAVVPAYTLTPLRPPITSQS